MVSRVLWENLRASLMVEALVGAWKDELTGAISRAAQWQLLPCCVKPPGP